MPLKSKKKERSKVSLRRLDKKATREQFDAFMAERFSLEARGYVLCEHAGGEECNVEAEYLHRTHDSDDHTIPVCSLHSCPKCVPMTGPKAVERRMRYLKQNLSSKFLNQFTDDCERRPQDLGLFDLSLYGMTAEILALRKGLRALLHHVDTDGSTLTPDLVEDIRKTLEKHDT